MTLSSVVELVGHMADPRGRCNRKGLLVVAGLLLAAEIVAGSLLWLAGADLDGPAVFIFKSICVWSAVCAGSKRLHDMNLRGWWMLAALAVTFVWSIILVVSVNMTQGAEALVPGTWSYFWILVSTSVPVFGATLWLHFRKGAPGVNRFGAEPAGMGFSGPKLDIQPVLEAALQLQHRLTIAVQRMTMPLAA
jgi:uncharacterized membrane protein YhaH (DUF805 family)